MLEHEAVVAHLARCRRCSAHMDQALSLRTLIGRRADATPPWTREESLWLQSRATRAFALAVGAATLAMAAPGYLIGHTAEAPAHITRHIASWQIAFAVGLFVLAWRPRLTHALLMMATTVGALSAIATALDIASGQGSRRVEILHLLEVAGAWIIWRITPPSLRPAWRAFGSGQRARLTEPARDSEGNDSECESANEHDGRTARNVVVVRQIQANDPASDTDRNRQ